MERNCIQVTKGYSNRIHDVASNIAIYGSVHVTITGMKMMQHHINEKILLVDVWIGTNTCVSMLQSSNAKYTHIVWYIFYAAPQIIIQLFFKCIFEYTYMYNPLSFVFLRSASIYGRQLLVMYLLGNLHVIRVEHCEYVTYTRKLLNKLYLRICLCLYLWPRLTSTSMSTSTSSKICLRWNTSSGQHHIFVCETQIVIYVRQYQDPYSISLQPINYW